MFPYKEENMLKTNTYNHNLRERQILDLASMVILSAERISQLMDKAEN